MDKIELQFRLQQVIYNKGVEPPVNSDVATAVLDFFKDNLKDIVGIDRKKLTSILEGYTQELVEQGMLCLIGKNFLRDLKKENPIKLKEINE